MSMGQQEQFLMQKLPTLAKTGQPWRCERASILRFRDNFIYDFRMVMDAAPVFAS